MNPPEKLTRRRIVQGISALAAGAALRSIRGPAASGAAAAGAAAAAASEIAAPAAREPIRLSAGPQLFVDDTLVAASENLTHTFHHPQRLPEPLVRGADSPDRCGQPYVTVLRDPQTGRFRMWYDMAAEAGRRGSLAYMESPDGIAWERPPRLLLPINGYGASILDEGPDCPDPSRRFRYAYWEQLDSGHHTRSKAVGMCVAFSPDGIEWTKFAGNPVLPDLWKFSPEADPRHIGDPRFKQTASDIVDVAYDPARQRYVASIKSYTQPPEEFGPVSRTYEWGRRLVSQSTSDDFVNWTTPRRIIVPDGQDKGDVEFYGMPMIPRGQMLIGLLRVLRDDVGDGIGYSTLAISRDGGQTWRRLREPFFENRASDPDAFDHAVAWLSRPLRVGDELFFYYGGYNKGHKVFTDRQLGLAKLRYDGFASWNAAASGGTLRTRPIVLPAGAELTVNADVAGDVRVRLTDAEGKAVAGFDFSDCTPIRGDDLAHPVRWGGGGGSGGGGATAQEAARGRPLRVEFALENARLYGFACSPPAGDRAAKVEGKSG